nr:hypothetical protein Iba_chr05dCG9350 [Ipomoea batatas]
MCLHPRLQLLASLFYPLTPMLYTLTQEASMALTTGALGDAQPSLPMLWPREFGGLTLPAYIGKSLPYLCCLRMDEDVCIHHHALSLEGTSPTLKGCAQPSLPMP